MNIPPPVRKFEDLKPITMTVIVSYDVHDLNLPMLFRLLPVTSRTIENISSLPRKQGKIKFPSYMNTPGEILNLRFKQEYRGIPRSQNTTSFDHTILGDIGTTSRITAIKLSATMEITGALSIEHAKETAEYVFDYMRHAQSMLDTIMDNKDTAYFVRDKYLEYLMSGISMQDMSDTEKKIWDFYHSLTQGCSYTYSEMLTSYLTTTDVKLYNGSLDIKSCSSEMTNLHFNIGISINQFEFAQIQNTAPFKIMFNNHKNSSVTLLVPYEKIVKGKVKICEHNIRVNKSGHVCYSGPGPDKMRNLYYAFWKLLILNYEKIRSDLPKDITLSTSKATNLSSSWYHTLDEQRKFIHDIITDELVK